MKESYERLAWTVLFISFALFLALLFGLPFGLYQWVQRATLPPHMALQVLEGAAQIEPPEDTPRLVLPEDEPIKIRPGTIVFNDADAETLLTIHSPDEMHTLGTVQIYPSTRLEVSLAKSPRYGLSKAPHRLEVSVLAGRARLSLARDANGGRAIDFRCRTPHAQFLLWEAGSYALDVNEQQAQITVREGTASIISGGEQLELQARQRGIVGVDGKPFGPLSPERDLITNGHFRQPLEQGWQIRTDAADGSQSAGEVKVESIGGRDVVQLSRVGIGHAETGIVQLINENINGYPSLHLHLSAQLDSQSLGVCGAVGSECPLMLRIDYEDAAGSPRQWVQGFYYWVDPAVANPTLCETCPPPRQKHEQHNQGVQFFYDSPNLVALLAQNGRAPTTIVSIAVYASGHSYNVWVGEIELLVEE